jgi:DDE superfamily endonuclease
MDRKGEVVNSRMLLAKWEVFEEAMNVPDDERLPGPGWIQSICHAHKLKEIRKYGEAGSVDIETVKKERACIKELLARFQPEDRWNVDEFALFAFAPPDHGLSQRQMSGKQASKFCITLAFACNSNGSEKRDLFFIGKSKKPHCFGQQGRIARGFYYRSNKMAWMTGVLLKSGSCSGILSCSSKTVKLLLHWTTLQAIPFNINQSV